MKTKVAAGVVIATIFMTACTTGQPSGGGPTAPSLTPPSVAAPSMAAPSLSVPTLSPTPTKSSPSPAASSATAWVLTDGPLFAGTYRIGQWDTTCSAGQPGCSPSPAHDAIRVTLTVPDGWGGLVGSIAVEGEGNSYETPNAAGLLVGRGAWLLSNPCTKAEHAIPPDVAVGPSVDDLADAIADHPLLDAADPVDVKLAGYSGKYLDLQVPADISMCEVYRPWDPGIYAQGPGQQWHLWILDVDSLRFTILTTTYEGTSTRLRKELTAIVDSITIEP